MSERSMQLHRTADEQIAALIDLVSALDDTTLRLPCPGREKLGDGTIAAAAKHAADNYQLIARFVETGDKLTSAREPHGAVSHRIPRFLNRVGHRPPDHADHAHGTAAETEYTAERVDLRALLGQLTATRESLGRIATLTDSQLGTIPPDGSFKFCDGRRTVDEVLTSLLKHQGHQVDAVTSALA